MSRLVRLQDIRAAQQQLQHHPVQYAFRYGTGLGPFGTVRWHTESLYTPDDEQWERYNRCPTCEEWSPCTVRKALLERLLALEGGTSGMEPASC